MNRILRKSVPFKQQMADADCGAACLAMILAFHGQDISVYGSKLACEEHGPPQAMKSILAAARGKGLVASMLASDLDGMKELRLPCILHWKFNHFVTLEAIRGEVFTICDPAMGRRRVHLAEFRKCYTGVCAVFEPGPAFRKGPAEKAVAFRAYARRVLLDRRTLGPLLATVSAALLIQLLSLLSPWFTIYVVDVLIPLGDSHLLRSLLALILITSATIAALSYLRSRMIVLLQRTIDGSLLDGFIEHLMHLPARFFLEKSAGDIQSRMNSSTVIRDAASTYAVTSILDAILAISYIAILAFMALPFAALTLGIALAQVGLYVMNNRRLRDRLAAELKTQAMYQGYVYELLTGILTVKAAGAEANVERIWKRKLHNYLVSAQERSMTDGAIAAGTSTLRIAAPALLLWYSVALYLQNSSSLGSILALNTVSAMALVPLSTLVSTVRQVQLVRTHAERLGDVWMHGPESFGQIVPPALTGPGMIRFSEVHFRYKASVRGVLNGLNLTIPLGKRVGIVGSSGCGKSTLVALLLGFHRPSEGNLLLGDMPLHDYDLSAYRKSIGYVSQVTFLFNSSIRQNVMLGAPEAPLDVIEAALELVGMRETIANMPMGLETIVGENGASLSGGQRQRIAIARAIAIKPQLLILDEATSSLDSSTEQLVARGLRSLNCTQVIITHRLSTIQDCDLIYVMNDGCVDDQGTHRELLETNAFYRSSFELQGAGGIRERDAQLAL